MNQLERDFTLALAKYHGHKGDELPRPWRDRPLNAAPLLAYDSPVAWVLGIEGTPPCGGVVLAWPNYGTVHVCDGKRRSPLRQPIPGHARKGDELYRAAMALARDLDARWRAPMREIVDLADAAWQRGDGRQ